MKQIPEKIDSKFRFVLLASTRAEQIMRGAAPKVDEPSSKPTRAAMEEILSEKVGWEYGPEQTAEEAGDGAVPASESGDSESASETTEN
ncbi:MAG: DNA-directed RNA polymerase subunit omega [Acidobacteriota bacterium]